MAGENGITKELVQNALQKCKDLDDGKTNLSPITDVLEMAEKECLTEREAQQILRRRSRIETTLAYVLMELTPQEMGEEAWGKEWEHSTILRWIRKGEKTGIQGFIGSVLSVKKEELRSVEKAAHAVSRTLAYAMSHIDYEKCCFRETPLSLRETEALLLKLDSEALHETMNLFMNWARCETDRAKVLDQLWDENKSARAALRLIFTFFGEGRETDPKEIVWEGTLLPADVHLREEVIGILNTVMAKNPVPIDILPTASRDGELLQSTRAQCNRLQDENGKLKERIQALGHVIADLQMDKEARQ